MRQGNLADLPFEAGTFDVVVNFQVIEHLWDQGKFVRGVRPCAAPVGSFADVDPQPHHVLPGRDTPINPFTPANSRRRAHRIAHDNGFAVEAMLGSFTAPVGRAGRPPRRVDHRRADQPRAGRCTVARRTPRRHHLHPHRDFDLLEARDSSDIDESLDLVAIAVRRD